MKTRHRNTNHISYVISMVIYTLIALLGGWRVWRTLSILVPSISLWIYLVVYLILCSMLPLGFFLHHSKRTKLLDILGNYWICFQLTFFFASLSEWIISLLLVSVLQVVTKIQYSYVSLAIFSLTMILTIYGIVHARIVKITEYDCPVNKQMDRKELRILHLSDLHLGSVNDLRAMEKVVKRVNMLAPDIICITGDTFTENVRDIFEFKEIESLFRTFRSKYGVYACLGNHDSGDEFEQMLEFFKKANIRLLRDEYVEWEDFVVLGRTDMTPGGDMTYKRKNIEECLGGVELDKLLIVLDHQPGELKKSQKAGVDILLSGHTHGGQFFPVHRMVSRIFPHYYGYKKYGQMHSIISSGTCTAIPPIRVGSCSEIVMITVHQSV